MDGYSHRFESTIGRDNKPQKKKGTSHHSSTSYDDGERKPKFVSMATKTACKKSVSVQVKQVICRLPGCNDIVFKSQQQQVNSALGRGWWFTVLKQSRMSLLSQMPSMTACTEWAGHITHKKRLQEPFSFQYITLYRCITVLECWVEALSLNADLDSLITWH